MGPPGHKERITKDVMILENGENVFAGKRRFEALKGYGKATPFKLFA